LEAQATTDALTGLPNRRAFDQLLARRPGRLPFCILAIDLDDLKQVNDTLGHTAGDNMLVHVSRVLAAELAATPFGGSPAGVSIGIASGGPEDKGQFTHAAADAAMYRAKRNGGSRSVVASQVDEVDETEVDVGPAAAAVT
jgi:GGDEF domain-containing protein